MKLNQTKQALIDSLKQGQELLGNRSWIPGVIDAIQGIALPDLEGDWEYNIQWVIGNDYRIIKYRQIKNVDGIWEQHNEEVITEFTV